MEELFSSKDVEILISTMNRNSMDFLIPMFPFCHYAEYSIIIINQTQEDNLLVSEFNTVKIINSFEKGLSTSRNLALKNATGKIVLLADDDVVFLKNFTDHIVKAYNKNQNFSVICFQTSTKEGFLYSNYPTSSKELNKHNLEKVLSIEVTCKREDLLVNNCWFNMFFGLGAKFQDSETFFFLRHIKFKGLKILFTPENIVIHEAISSSDDVSSDRVIYARMAGFYKCFGFGAYVLLLKYIFFLIRKYHFSLVELRSKFFVGLSGVNDYRLIVNNKLDSKYE